MKNLLLRWDLGLNEIWISKIMNRSTATQIRKHFLTFSPILSIVSLTPFYCTLYSPLLAKQHTAPIPSLKISRKYNYFHYLSSNH